MHFSHNRSFNMLNGLCSILTKDQASQLDLQWENTIQQPCPQLIDVLKVNNIGLIQITDEELIDLSLKICRAQGKKDGKDYINDDKIVMGIFQVLRDEYIKDFNALSSIAHKNSNINLSCS